MFTAAASSSARAAPYRVFGSPYALATRQAVVYLRHKQLPVSLHCSSLWSVRLQAWWYGATTSYGNMAPSGESFPLYTDLIAHCEAAHPTPVLQAPLETHPQHRTVAALLNLYGMWWLMNTGGMFRWVHGEGSREMIAAYASFFMLSYAAPLAGQLGRSIQLNMQDTLDKYGMSHETEPYVLQHFTALCAALDHHFARHATLLGTPSPQLCDVTLAAAFEGQFLQDDPPRGSLTDGTYPNLEGWLKRMADAPRDDAEVSMKGDRYHDGIPETLQPLLSLAMEVLPWMVAQCDAVQEWGVGAGNGRTAVRQTSTGVTPCGSLFGKDSEVDGVFKVHQVDRVLPCEWAMAVDEVVKYCHVSVPHVHLAQLAAKEVEAIDLSSPRRAVSDSAPALLPDDAIADVRDALLRCRMPRVEVAPVVKKGGDFRYALWERRPTR